MKEDRQKEERGGEGEKIERRGEVEREGRGGEGRGGEEEESIMYNTTKQLSSSYLGTVWVLVGW